MVVRVVRASIFFRSPDNLEVVSVQVEGMLASIAVVENDLDDLAFLKDKCVRVAAVDLGIGRSVTRRENRV